MSDEIDEGKPGISPGAIAHSGLLSRRVGGRRIHGATHIHRVFARRKIIYGLISSGAAGVVSCAQIRVGQYPMGIIEDLGFLFVSGQVGVRLKVPYGGSVCILYSGHTGSVMK